MGIEHSPLSRQVFQAPLYVSWNYTYACNFNCKHCYSRASQYPRELTTDQFLDIAQQLIDVGVFGVGLGGGEVLVRKDCFAIIERLARARVAVNLTSNGWFIDHDIAPHLSQCGLTSIYLSLDSANPLSHDAFRQQDGSYARVLAAAKHLTNNAIDLRISTVISKMNILNLHELVALAENLGASAIEFKRFRASGNGLRTKEQYALTQDDLAIASKSIKLLRECSSIRIDHVDSTQDAPCPCGIKSLVIRPNGDVAPCAYSETVIGNLVNDSLSEIWLRSPQLQALRSAGSCEGLFDAPNPSSPDLGVKLFPRHTAKTT